MKKIRKLFVFIVLALPLSGCLQIDTTIHVNKDGSGTISEKVLFSKSFVDMIRGFSESFQDSAGSEEFTMFKEEDIFNDAQEYGENVKYVSHELVSEENWEGYKAVFSFDDITRVKLSPDPDSKVDLGDGSPQGETGGSDFYYFRFVKGNTPELIIERPDEEFSQEESESEETNETTGEEQDSNEMNDQIVKMMEGMKINMGIEVDGKITGSNATYVEGSKVTLFQMDLAEMMKNKEGFDEFRKNEPQNIDQMKKYLEKLPGIKIEFEKPVSIKFN